MKSPGFNVRKENFQELTPWLDNHHVLFRLLTPLSSLTVPSFLNPLITLYFLTSLPSASWPQIILMPGGSYLSRRTFPFVLFVPVVPAVWLLPVTGPFLAPVPPPSALHRGWGGLPLYCDFPLKEAFGAGLAQPLQSSYRDACPC